MLDRRGFYVVSTAHTLVLSVIPSLETWKSNKQILQIPHISRRLAIIIGSSHTLSGYIGMHWPFSQHISNVII